MRLTSPWLLTALLLLGCKDHVGAVCVPYETRACTCPGGVTRAQTCDESGSGWGECPCDQFDTSTDGDDLVEVEDTTPPLCTSDTDCPGEESCIGPCPLAQLCEAGLDGILGTADDMPGAGICIPDLPTCMPSPVEAEGGDTLNGTGSPNEPNSVSVFCIGRTNSAGVDTVVGLGGPGRLRRRGTHLTNGFTSLP